MQAAKGTIKNVYAVRFEPGEDVQESILKVCEQYEIRHGMILTALGSLNGASFFDPAPIPGKPGLYAYGDPIELPAPVELISLSGIICEGEGGDTQCHIHCSMADEKGTTYSGHFKEGNKVLTTVEMVIAEVSQIYMGREVEPTRGVSVFSPRQL